MHSYILLTAATFATAVAAQFGEGTSYDLGQIEKAVEGAIPPAIKPFAPDESRDAYAVAQLVTSMTAQAAFSTAIAALETAVPSAQLQDIENAPGSFLLEVATGTEPSYFKSLPTNVINYIERVAEECLSLLEGGAKETALPSGLLPTTASAPTGGYYGYKYPTATGTMPVIVFPTGTAPVGALPPTGLLPPTGVVPTGATGASGTGFPAPTGNSTSYTGGTPSPSPEPFKGAAAPRNGAIGFAALVAGATLVFIC